MSRTLSTWRPKDRLRRDLRRVTFGGAALAPLMEYPLGQPVRTAWVKRCKKRSSKPGSRCGLRAGDACAWSRRSDACELGSEALRLRTAGGLSSSICRRPSTRMPSPGTTCDGSYCTNPESPRPCRLLASSLPVRYYIPMLDVRMDLLESSDTISRCPYKGVASYWSVRLGGTLHADLAWSYRSPIPECPKIENLIAFFNERVDLDIDEERVQRPQTPWSVGPDGQAPNRVADRAVPPADNGSV